jgi:hypothetical protein
MHRFLSRSDESADLTRRETRKRVPQGPRKRTLCSTLRRPTECNKCGAHSTTDDFGAAVENLCLVRAVSLIEDFQNFFQFLLNFGKGRSLIRFGRRFE